MKIVLNKCYGGFGLSDRALSLYNKKAKTNISWARDIDRSDPVLIKVVEMLGEEVNTRFSELKIVEIPDGVDWEITEYDGIEQVAEKHRSWG